MLMKREKEGREEKFQINIADGYTSADKHFGVGNPNRAPSCSARREARTIDDESFTILWNYVYEARI